MWYDYDVENGDPFPPMFGAMLIVFFIAGVLVGLKYLGVLQ